MNTDISRGDCRLLWASSALATLRGDKHANVLKRYGRRLCPEYGDVHGAHGESR
ncbi:MAG: hypothetical protein Q7T26_09185 [Dehalococcoidia bacterium]|nr:hypothetical protein [Dehalococcoidia bacterium]